MDAVIWHLKYESKGTRRMVNNFLFRHGALDRNCRSSRRKFRKIKRKIANQLRRIGQPVDDFYVEWELVRMASKERKKMLLSSSG